MSGFIALHRGPNTNELRKDRNAFLLLSLIADRARWREDPCPVTGLQQGQAMLGKGDCEAIGLTEKNRQQLRSALKRLERMGFVTTQPTTRGTVVTLMDQSIFSIAVNPPTTQPTTQPTINQPSSNHQVTTKNKETPEQGNTGTKEQGNSPPKSPKGDLAKVEAIYQEYPKKKGKPSAIKAITKALKQIDHTTLLERTKAYAKARQDEDDQFTPHPATWFNDERFNDDPSTWKSQSNRPGTSKPPPKTIEGPEGWKDAYRALFPDWGIPEQWGHVAPELRPDIEAKIEALKNDSLF